MGGANEVELGAEEPIEQGAVPGWPRASPRPVVDPGDRARRDLRYLSPRDTTGAYVSFLGQGDQHRTRETTYPGPT